METQHIRFVRTVAKLKNISAAARDLGMTQPALTKIVSRVEDQVGAKLFERGARGVSLTPIGELFLKRMERVEREMTALVGEVRARNHGVSGTVSLAVGQFWLGRILPGVIANLNRSAPGIQVRIKTGSREELVQSLKDGESDFMLGRITRDMPPGILCEKLANVRMFLIAGEHHPLAGLDRSVEPEELARFGWVLPPRSDPTIRYAFTEFGIEPPVATVEAVSRQFIDSILPESDFLTVVPGIDGRQVGPGLTIIRADWLVWSSKAGVMTARDRQLPPYCHRFLDALREDSHSTTQV